MKHFYSVDTCIYQVYKYFYIFTFVCLCVKDLMLKSGKTKNVIAATNKPSLLPMLEDLQRRFVKFEVYSF